MAEPGTITGQKILFVLGAPRSGTKLLRYLLAQNPAIAMTTNETEFLPFLIAYEHASGFDRAQGFARFVDYLRLEDYFAHRLLEGHSATDFEAWETQCADFSAAEVFRAFLTTDVEGAGEANVLVDKSPGYLRILSRIIATFPGACVLHIVRDPRAQVGSLRATFGKPVLTSARAWRDALAQVARQKAAGERRILELRYEDLTEAPELWLRRICEFLDVPFDKAMLKVRSELERARPGDKPIGLRKADLAAYEHYLSDAEIASVEAICADGMAKYGYVPVRPSIAAPRESRVLAKLARLGSLARLAVLTVRRHGCGALLRKIRLARARRRIMAGTW